MKPQNMTRLERFAFKVGIACAMIVYFRFWIGGAAAVWLAFHYLG